MHIPDGYLSPSTCTAFYAVMTPIWYLAARRLERTMKAREISLLALAASFTFVIMMFNIPIPGGSTGHMVGAVVTALIIGPWGSLLSLTITLMIQALLFGDGGITALAANSFNMAFLMSFAGYYTYMLLAGNNPSASRRWLAAAIAGYIAMNISAIAVGLELGIQPLIAHTGTGKPLYAPYPLNVTLPAMVVSHLIFFGFIEAIGTAMVVSYAMRVGMVVAAEERGSFRPLWAGLIILVVLTPVGLLAGGTAWGEWSSEELIRLLGYLPEGFERFEGIWQGIMPDYRFPGLSGAAASALGYMLSAAIGSGLIVSIIYLLGRIWQKR